MGKKKIYGTQYVASDSWAGVKLIARELNNRYLNDTHQAQLNKLNRMIKNVNKSYFDSRDKYYKKREKVIKYLNETIIPEHRFDKREGLYAIGKTSFKDEKVINHNSAWVSNVSSLSSDALATLRENIASEIADYNIFENWYDFESGEYRGWITRVKNRLGVPETVSDQKFLEQFKKIYSW